MNPFVEEIEKAELGRIFFRKQANSFSMKYKGP